MPINPKGPPRKPGLSIRGRVIYDTVRGVPRVRPWPPKKPTKPGTKRNLTAKAFGAANRACKVTASTFYGAHWEATRGTPLLPRDLMIALMYGRAFALITEDGRIIRSMASRNDVSKSLDFIGNTPGNYLVRGPTHWEARQTAGTVNGAMLGFASDKSNQNYTTPKLITWDTVRWQVGQWVDLSANPEVITVPQDVAYVRMTAMLVLTDVTANNNVRAYLRKNGVTDFVGFTGTQNAIPGGTRYLNFSSAPIPVATGDELSLELGVTGDTSIGIFANQTSFAVEALG